MKIKKDDLLEKPIKIINIELSILIYPKNINFTVFETPYGYTDSLDPFNYKGNRYYGLKSMLKAFINIAGIYQGTFQVFIDDKHCTDIDIEKTSLNDIKTRVKIVQTS